MVYQRSEVPRVLGVSFLDGVAPEVSAAVNHSVVPVLSSIYAIEYCQYTASMLAVYCENGNTPIGFSVL